MAGFHSRVDPLSEMLALSAWGNTKNIVVTAMEVSGPFDEQVGELAIRRATEKFPHMTSCVREVKDRGRYHLVWERRPDRPMPIILTEMNNRDGTLPFLQRLLDHLRPRLDREWNLFEETAAEIHFVRVTKEHHVLASFFHHVAADAGTASEFGREFLLEYHRLRTGQDPQWAQEAAAISSSDKRKVKVRTPTWREALAGARQTLTHMFERPILPAGTGVMDDTREHHVKRILSEEDTELVGKLAAKKGVSPVDLLAACANMAVDQWNEPRNIEPGLLTSTMTVNTRGRFAANGQPNSSAVIFFRSRPRDRADLAAFCRSLALTRIHHFRKQKDLQYMRDVERMMSSIRFFPYNVRQRIVHRVVNRHQFSIAVTLLGVIWPKIRRGKPTAETALTQSAELTVSEIHGLGYKLLSSTDVVLIVYGFRNRLNLILACSAARFIREESEAFMDLIMENLVQTPRKMLVEKIG